MGGFGIGCMNFGWLTEARDAETIIAESLSSGIEFFDTSVSYGRGASEIMIGQILRKLKARNKVVLATKFGSAATDDDKVGNGRCNIVRHCELSLLRLQTDHIDLLQMHHDDTRVSFEEVFDALGSLVRQGKVLRVGVCNLTPARLREAKHAATSAGCPIVTHQVRLNLLDRRAEMNALPVGGALGIRTIAYAPLAEGMLSGRYNLETSFPMGSRFALASPTNCYLERMTPSVFGKLEKLKQLAHEHGLSLSALALAWVRGRPGVDRILVGCSSADQVAALRRLGNTPPLDAAIERSIDDIVGRGQSLA